ncbi:thiamine pyrophosphate-dependent dehydrogenase E1 component subunit alpha, partial [Micromonospora sp. NPDC002411]
FEHAVRLDYRPPDEVTRGRARDPVDIQGSRLSDADRAAVDAEVEATVDAAVDFALASPQPDPADAMAYLYASGLTARTGGG